MNKLPCCLGSHGEVTHRILLGCLQMLGFCTSQALECTNFLQENSAAPPWWRAQGLGQTLLLSTNIQTRLHYFCCFCSSLHKNNQWWFPPEFSALPSWLISRFYSLKPCPFCWVKLGTFAQFLCSHIDVAAFPWQVKQFTNTCKQVCCKRRTRIFWWSKEKKKKSMPKIVIPSQAD